MFKLVFRFMLKRTKHIEIQSSHVKSYLLDFIDTLEKAFYVKSDIEISNDGTIMVQPEGAPVTEQDEVARIKFVNPDVRLMEKGNDGLFRLKNGVDAVADITVKMQSGTLESSNVSAISEMTDMIALQRQFEMQLKLMATAEEVDKSASSLLRAF